MEAKTCNNFISYVGLNEHELENLGIDDRKSLDENNIKLLPGEVVVAKANNVLMFEPVSDTKRGVSGFLSVTNFKLSFITAENNDEDNCIRNRLYGFNDTCLSNVDTIYMIISDKKKKLVPGSLVPSKVKGVFIICKNFRTWSFSFKFSQIGDGRNIITALLHYAFPTKHHLLFGYEYKESYYSNIDKDVHLFRNNIDWQNEVDRTLHKNATLRKGWRLSTVNVEFQICQSLSEYIIVPASVTDIQLIKAAQHFQGSRPPVWSWSNDKGAALVKMSELCPNITERTQENVMLENIRKNHPKKLQPVIIELNKDISVKSVSSSYSKFMNLCAPESAKQFISQENSFLTLLENSKWLRNVSHCLSRAVEASDKLNEGVPVILQEGSGRDICCVVSSLTQLLSDPYFRTITGFQSLIQKEWIASGHPFCDRLGHLRIQNGSDSSEKAPIFLLYLDCVWQLLQQFPAEFEFTETYLTTMWDSAHITIFETFMFNCEKDRIRAATDVNYQLILRSVWDWREQFSEEYISLFYSPLFDPGSKKQLIRPFFSIPCLEIWTQCYYRWIPCLAINNGGKVSSEMYLRELQNEISQLQMSIAGSSSKSAPIEQVTNYFVQQNINSFYPFINSKSGESVSTPVVNTSFMANESMADSQSLSSVPD